MISVTSIRVEGKNFTGLRAEPPKSPPLLVIIAKKGFVMCGFLNVETAEKLKVTAAVVSDVKTFDDVLNGQVKAVTSKAKSLGIEAGMKGVEALKQMG